ncbi:hypothetical protein CUN59_03720 [Cuspidothrix issatschenkoi CHARLIE-1]|uniref:Uncharacterized protein n=1 Tax=Cuspidothrix issatschenkoi CHARLIE-1 TaxID=2052836 RepID=A0A2S6CXR2_9CYAN|nr:hypothetical protein CUN59_03720 [Cuspidothrix issatschenkoi CHARLIE-1]
MNCSGISRLGLKIVLGAREQGTPKRVLGDFTFLHIPLNFSVYLLTICIIWGHALTAGIFVQYRFWQFLTPIFFLSMRNPGISPGTSLRLN